MNLISNRGTRGGRMVKPKITFFSGIYILQCRVCSFTWQNHLKFGSAKKKVMTIPNIKVQGFFALNILTLQIFFKYDV